MLLLLLIEN